MAGEIPQVDVHPARSDFWERASFIWFIPILALLVALGVAWQSYSKLGRVIEVSFPNGAGIAENSTELRFRDIAVGVVEGLGLSDDLETVTARIRLEKDIGRFVDENAQFWVVRPEVTTRGVTGLDTVLTGVFIEGSWDNEPGTPASQFLGLSEEPLFRPDRPGLQLALRSSANGNMVENSPILFRGLEVGRVGKATINPQGNFAVAEAIIYDPHTRLITDNTRFWDTSGFSISVGASGASIDFSSLASLVAGGLTFDTFLSGGARANDGARFEVYADENDARNSIFNRSEVEELVLSAVFDDNIAGLAIDAPVELGGLRIGAVRSVSGVINPEEYGDNRVRLNAILAIQPTRLGLPEPVTQTSALEFFQESAADGLRARLASASLLTGGLKVEFIRPDGIAGAPIRQSGDGPPVVPTTQSEISDAATTVEGLLTRVNNLPVEELLVSAIDFLDGARALVTDEALRETPEDLRALLQDIRTVVASDEVQDVVPNLNRVLVQIETLMATLETEQTVTRLVAAIDAAAATARTIDTSVAGVPGLIDTLNEVAQKARDLPLEELTSEASALVNSGSALLGSDGAQDLPVTLNAALQEIDATLRELRAGGAVANVNQTLASARDAADAVAGSTRDLPGLVERMTRVLDQASATIQGYDQGDTISRDAQSALRDIKLAAEAVTSLARTLERNPSLLIRGR